MNDERVLRELQSVSISDYLLACREYGRQSIPASMRQSAAELHRRICDFRSSSFVLSLEVRRALELATDFLSAESYLHQHSGTPRYVHYTNLAVLDRYLGAGTQISLESTLARCGTALSLLVRDWRDFETAAALGFPERYNRTNFQQAEVRERIRGLDELAKLTTRTNLPGVHPVEAIPTHAYRSDWIYFACEADGAIGLVHLTGVPQSLWHDEYMFLRTIHLSEIAFHGIVESARAAIVLAHEGAFSTAETCMSNANYYASFLVKLFALFDTMPIASFFDGFRVATGNASAIQSTRYQILERVSRGIAASKQNSLQNQPDGRSIANWSLPDDWSLLGLVRMLQASGDDERTSLIAQVEGLDRYLHMWRAKHLGIARRYLPPATRGTGDEGVPYLEANVRDPMIRQVATVSAEVKPGRLRVTAAAQIVATEVEFHWCELTGLDSVAVCQALAAARAETNDRVRARKSTVQGAIEIYERFFADHQRTCPLGGQLRRAIDAGVPTQNPVAELILSIELTAGVLAGVFDLRMIADAARLDVAVDGESFDSIASKQVRCRNGDWVLRDGKSIFASYFDGPDGRTAVDARHFGQRASHQDVAVLIFGAPNLPAEMYAKAREEVEVRLARHAANSEWFAWDF